LKTDADDVTQRRRLADSAWNEAIDRERTEMITMIRYDTIAEFNGAH